MSNPAIELRGVSKHFGSVIALQDIDIKVYPGATHSFFNGRPGAANAAAAQDAWGRLLAFFGQHLPAKTAD